jgi:hypothetical protein
MGWTRDELAKRSDDQVAAIATRVCNRLAKWRSVFAGWQLGTRLDTDPESQAVRDHREVTMLMRAEINALTACCIEAGLFTARQFTEQMILEAEHLSVAYSEKFPGMTATDDGITYDLLVAAETMKGWLP